MKTTRIFSRAFFAGMLLSTALLVTSCDKDDDDIDDEQTYTLSGDASGAQESPAVTTAATGSLTGTYNSRTNNLDYTINWTGLSGLSTAAHFHGPAAAGSNAAVIADISLTTNGISGQAKGNVTLSDADEERLLNGQIYYNIHTTANADGEIRGQAIATKD
ncbi:MAG: CHRD domain-containing protein [Chitinophagaceae bacterium]